MPGFKCRSQLSSEISFFVGCAVAPEPIVAPALALLVQLHGGEPAGTVIVQIGVEIGQVEALELRGEFGVGSLRNHSFVQLALVDQGRKSVILDIAGYPPGERVKNQIGAREALPKQYGDAPQYTLVVAGGDTDIKPVPAIELEARIRRAHSLIWAGGRRDIPFPS